MCGCRAAVDLDGLGLGNHGNHEARYAVRRKDCFTRGKEANERECKGARIGIVSAWSLNWGSSRRAKGSEAGFTIRKKERSTLDFCGISRGSKCSGLELDDAVHRTEPPASDSGSVIKEIFAVTYVEMNAMDVTKEGENCSFACRHRRQKIPTHHKLHMRFWRFSPRFYYAAHVRRLLSFASRLNSSASAIIAVILLAA